jgi:hypothetical protein
MLEAATYAAGGRLSFAGIVHAWKDVPMRSALATSKFLQGGTEVDYLPHGLPSSVLAEQCTLAIILRGLAVSSPRH